MERPNTGEPGEFNNPDTLLELHGRLHVMEYLVGQLLYQGFKNEATKDNMVHAVQELENELHREIPLLHGDGKRVRQHALESLKQLTGALTLSVMHKPDKPV